MPAAFSGSSHAPAAGGQPNRLVVMLHGYGSDSTDIIRVAHVLAPDLPHAEFVAPNAPEPCDVGKGYQWFPLSTTHPEAVGAGLSAAAAALDDFVATALAERNLDPELLALVGFSQGAIMVLDRALRRPNSARAIVSFSGMLAHSSCLLEAGATRPSVLLVQGTADRIVPFARLAETKKVLEEAGFPVETMERPGLAHAIDHEGAARAARFLTRHLTGP